MRFFKQISDGYIITTGTGGGGTEITEEEHEAILSAVGTIPHKDGYGYMLREDLTWEEYQLDPPDPDPEIEDDELLNILMGVSE